MSRALGVRLLLLSLLFTAPAAAQSTTFRVTVPPSTPSADTVYIAGDFQGWNPGDPAYALTELPDGRWQIALDLLVGQPIQFKFTRGSWASVEKGPNGEELPNRVHTPTGGELLDLVVASWADTGAGGTISGHVESFTHPPFLGGRRVWVYLPPGYFDEPLRSYPVLYMHDGQNLFDDSTSFAGEWGVDEACEALIAAGEIEPLVVVGIENGGALRCTEYTPWPDPGVGGLCSGGGGGGEAYLQALRDVLMPEIALRYRVLAGPNNAYMAGSSLGGLISAYAGYAHADVWGRVAALSPSYWWAGEAMLAFAQTTGHPGLEQLYQDTGSTESNLDELLELRDIALAQGFVEGVDLLTVVGAGHSHNETFWRLRFPDVLRFLLDPGCDEVAVSYCVAAPNSVSTLGAAISAGGSCSVDSNGVELSGGPIAPGQPALFFHGATQVQLPFGAGFRCAGGAIVRVRPPVPAGVDGFVHVALDAAGPSGAGIEPGATRHFQLWYRDPAGGPPGFNLSHGLSLVFR